MKSIKYLWICAAACFAAMAAAPAWSQAYPNRPVILVCAFPAGSGADLTARALAPALGEALGQPVVVENRSGAGGGVGSRSVAKARNDGYTLLIAGISFSMLPSLMDAGYHPVKDFEPLIMMGTQQLFFVVSPTLPVSSLRELAALAKAQPGKLNYGTGGVGSIGHLQWEVFKKDSGTDIVHIPYKGTPEAMADVMAGRVQMAIVPVAVAMPQIKAGKLKALSVQGSTRVPGLTEVPTTEEAGFPNAGDAGWYIVLAPSGTPRDIVVKLNTALRQALAKPVAIDMLASAGVVPQVSTPDQASTYLKGQVAKWSRTVKEAGIPVEGAKQ